MLRLSSEATSRRRPCEPRGSHGSRRSRYLRRTTSAGRSVQLGATRLCHWDSTTFEGRIGTSVPGMIPLWALTTATHATDTSQRSFGGFGQEHRAVQLSVSGTSFRKLAQEARLQWICLIVRSEYPKLWTFWIRYDGARGRI